MWLATKLGFYSITRKSDDEYHVRARERVDLENLVAAAVMPLERAANPRPGADALGIYESGPKADYRYRMVLSRRGYHRVMDALTAAVTYDNFKSEVHKQPTQANKDRIYSAWWHDMFRLQNRGPEAEEVWEDPADLALFDDAGLEDLEDLEDLEPIEGAAADFFHGLPQTPYDAQ